MGKKEIEGWPPNEGGDDGGRAFRRLAGGSGGPPLVRLASLLFVVLVLTGVVLAFSGRLGLTNIQADQVGVLVNYVTGKTEVIQQPGYKIYIPFLEEVYAFDRTTQEFKMQGGDYRHDKPRPPARRARQRRLELPHRQPDDPLRDRPRRGDHRAVGLGARHGLQGGVDQGLRPLRPARRVRTLHGGRGRQPDGVQAGAHGGRRAPERAPSPHGIRIVRINTPNPEFDREYEEAIEERKEADQEVERLIAEADRLEQLRAQRLAAVGKEKEVEQQQLTGDLTKALLATQERQIAVQKDADVYATKRRAEGEAVLQELTNEARGLEAKYRKEAEGIESRTLALAATRRGRRAGGDHPEAPEHPLHARTVQPRPGAQAAGARGCARRPGPGRRRPPRRTGRNVAMTKLAKLFLLFFGLSLLLVLAAKLLIERVPPAVIGVKQALWGGTGVVEADFEMGFHLGITGYHKWRFLDKRTHFLTFAEHGTHTGVGQLMPPLVIRTKDNNTASFDLTVTYRVLPGQAHKMVQEGLMDVYRERVFTTVESIMREELAQLSSEDIYSTEKRTEVAANALPKLEQELKAFYVQPEQVLIRQVTFTPAYERKLQEKQLTYQQRLLATAEERVERQRAVTQTKEAEIVAAEKEMRGDWDKRLEKLRADNELAIAKILAEVQVYDKSTRAAADADYETLVADGNLAIARAEALRDELRNKALATRGGRILLAQEAAHNLNVEHVTLNSNDPSIPSILDVDELVRLLIGEDASGAE